MMIKGIGISSPNFVDNKNKMGQKQAYIGMNQPCASDSFTKSNVSFKGAAGVASDVEGFLNRVAIDYMASGEENLGILMQGKNKAVISNACKALVKGGHFERIEDFMGAINPGKLSQQNGLIVYDLTAELAKLSKTNNKTSYVISEFVQNLLDNRSVSDEVKDVIIGAFR